MSQESITRRDLVLGSLAVAGTAAFADSRAEPRADGRSEPRASDRAGAPAATGSSPAAALDVAHAALSRYVPRYMAEMNSPGLTLALANRAGDSRTACWGWSNREARVPVRADHLFQIGSITKSFVALVLLQLQDEGKLDLHAPVLEHLPWLPIEQPFGAVTTHHLLTHSSGFPSESPIFPLGGAKLVPHYGPGKRFHYSNWAYDVLGTIIEKIDGAPWPRAVERRIFAPLGMKASSGDITPAIAPRAASSYVPATDGAYARHGALSIAGPLTVTKGAGSIASTPGDMARYITMLVNRGAAPRGRIVSERAFEAFATPHVAAEEFGPGVHYGYGIAVDAMDGEKVLRHTGGMVSFMSSLQVSLDGGYGAFASINAQQGYRPNRVTRYALKCMRATRLGAAPPAAPPVSERDAPALQDYVGTYTDAAGRSLEVVAAGAQLVLVENGRRIPLDHASGDAFVAPDPAFAAYSIVFEREPAAPASAPGAAPAPRPVTILGYGDRAYFNARFAGSRADATSPALRALQGTYRSDDPWMGTLRVVARRGTLWAQTAFDGAVPLVQDGEHAFRLGERESPDVVRFDSFVDGVPQVLWLAGVPIARAPG